VGAGLSGFLGWKFGLPAVFCLAVLFALASIVSVLSIPRGSIDDRLARGLGSREESHDESRGLSVLLGCKPLLVLAACLALFHLGNAAMLPLYGLAVVAAKEGNPAAFVAATIVIAQATMILTSLVAMRMSEARGIWLVMLISLASLPIRGLIAACVIKSWGVFPVQILDGIGLLARSPYRERRIHPNWLQIRFREPGYFCDSRNSISLADRGPFRRSVVSVPMLNVARPLWLTTNRSCRVRGRRSGWRRPPERWPDTISPICWKSHSIPLRGQPGRSLNGVPSSI